MTSKHHIVKFTQKQFELYQASVQSIEVLSEQSAFYNSLRIALPQITASDDRIKKELFEPLIKSLERLNVSNKKPNNEGKKITIFNKPVKVNEKIQSFLDYVGEVESVSPYIVELPDITNTSKVRSLIKRYFILSKSVIDGGYKITNEIIKQLSPESLDMLKTKDGFEKTDDGFYFVSDKLISSFLIRIANSICK